MPKIKILKTLPVAVDGIHVKLFTKDQELEASEELANLLINKLKMASLIRQRTQMSEALIEPPEKAVIEMAPEKKEDPIIDEPMEDIQVFQLARDLSVPVRSILNKAKDLGIDAKAPVSKLTGKEAVKIKRAIGEDK